MNSKKLYFVLLGSLAIGFVTLVGGAYMGDQYLSKKAVTLTSLKAKSMALEQEKLSLASSKKQIAEYSELEKITRKVVPEDKNQAQAVGELIKIAEKNNITIAAITFPASTLGATAAPSAAAAAKAGAASSAMIGGGLGSSPSAAASDKAGALSQLQPISNIPGVYLLTINVQSDENAPVAYDKFIRFLGDLERNRRTAQVSNISLNPDTKDRNKISFALSINEYIKHEQ